MSENTCTMRTWEEHVVAGPEDGPRFAHAHTTFGYTGVIEGTSTCDYLLYYAEPGYEGAGQTAPGFERIEGSVDGRRGSFLVRHDVAYDASGIRDTWSVVPGSGTGELTGLTGTGSMAGNAESMPYTFDYRLG
ncbi:uncharacterized protein DUF3224 [Prauserella shujinwangii]|uniref:Uncharacterized protein DUF3224 n=1 Tax=Prauserella shujinwangii TaxID=1453103 RepID=A0A2T0LM88_9PSEU|nr:DUF3224 domain-containing protein [Prauserella shujinwangii]PRX44195.1 uncharacterized protein DUF3224 [Prauserella shujinwangii]